MSQPPVPISQIAAGLQEHLPASLSAVILPLAELLTALLAGKITSSDAEAQLQTESFVELRSYLVDHQLAVGQLQLSVPIAGTAIHIGDLQDSKGIAIGHGSVAQVAEGYSNALAAPGGIAIVVTGLSEVMLEYFQQLEREMRRISDAWAYASPTPERSAWIVPKEYRTEKDCPYPGLDSFTQQDVYRFFGRIDDVASFLARDHTPLAAITSRDSGVGKSSFVHAGVIPAMERDAKAMNQPLHVLPYRLSTRSDILADFAYMLAATTQSDETALLKAFRHDDTALVDVLRLLRTTPTTHVLLVLDQFEELFHGDEHAVGADRRHLLNNLIQVANEDAHWLTVLVVGRQSFYDQVDFKDRSILVQNLDVTRFELRGLTDLQLTQAIEGPLQVFHQRTGEVVRFKDGLVNRMLQDFLKVPGLKQSALPLLQFLLVRLWTEHGQLDIDHYDRLGGIGRAFVDRADTIYFGFQGSLRRAADAILIALVQPGLEPEDTTEDRPLVRRRASISKQIFDDPQRPEIKKVVTDLWNNRITTERPGPEQMISFEITHEVLLDTWPILRQLQNSYLDIINQRERLLPLAEQWRREQQPRYLYQNSDIGDAKKYLDRPNAEPLLDEIIRRCYEASIAHQKKLRWRNFMFGVGGLLFAIAIAALSALLLNASLREQVGSAGAAQATAERQAAKQNSLRESLDLAASSRTAKGAGEDEAAILLALEAALREDTIMTNAALREALSNTGWQPSTLTLDDNRGARVLAWSPDGTTLLLATAEKLFLINRDGTQQAACAARRVEHAVWRPDGSAFAMAGRDGLIMVRRTVDCADIATLRGHGGAVTRLSWSSDGNLLLSSAEDSTVRIWELATAHEIRQLPADHRYVQSVEFSPMQERLLVATNQSIQVWGMNGGSPLLTLPILATADARWTSDGEGILVDNKVKTILYDSHTGALLVSFKGSASVHVTRGPQIALSPNGKLLATVDGTTLRIWEVKGGRAVQQINGIRGNTSQIEWSLDGRQLLTAGGNAIQLWDTDTDTELATLPSADSLVSLSPDGQTIASAGLNASDVRFWRSLSTVARIDTAEHSGTVLGGTWSPDGRMIATWSETTAFVWDTLSGKLVRSLPTTDKIAGLRWSPQGAHILVDDGGVLLLYDAIGSGAPFPLINPNDNYGTAGRWNGDGSRLLALTRGGISAWDASTGAFLQMTPLGSTNTSLVKLSPDGTLAVVVDDGILARVIRLVDGSEVIRLAVKLPSQTHIDNAIWSSDDQRLAIEASGKVTTWRVSDGAQLATLDGYIGYRSLTWSPDGTQILATDGQNLAKLWDAESGHVQITFTGHKGRLSTVQWSPDERRILTAADDGTVRVWSVRGDGSQYIIETDTSEAGLLHALWSPDGSRVLVVGHSKVATIYALETADLLAIGACSVGRDLRPEEMARYGVPEPRRFRFAERVCPPKLTWAAAINTQPTPIPVATLFPVPTALVDDLQQAVYNHFNDYGNNRQLKRVCREGHGAVVEFQLPASNMSVNDQSILVRRFGRWSVLEVAPESLTDPITLHDAGLPENFSCLDPLRATMVAITPLLVATQTATLPTPTVTPAALSEEDLSYTIRRTVGSLTYAYDIVRVCREGLLAVGLIEPQAGSVGETIVVVVSQEQSGWQQRFLGSPTGLDDMSERTALGLRADSPCLRTLFAPWPIASAASATDSQGDVADELVDITAASATYEEGRLTVVFTLRALTEQVPFNRNGVHKGQGEYEYSVNIYTDGHSLPQDTRPPPADYLLTAIRIADGGQRGSSSLQTLLEGFWMEREGNSASYRQSGTAQVFVDVKAGTVTLVSRVPTIVGARLLLVATDSGGEKTLQDRVELLLTSK